VIGALNQPGSISVEGASLLSANIVNVTARILAFSRTGPTVALELRSPFVIDSIRVTLNVIPSFKSNPIILSVLPSVITEYAAVPIVVVLTNFPPIQNASSASWSLTHPSRTVNGTASILTYSSLSGDAQITIQLPYDTKRLGKLNFTLYVWFNDMYRGSFMVSVLPRSPMITSISPFAIAASASVNIKIAVIFIDFPQFTPACIIDIQNIQLPIIDAVTNSVNGRLQRVEASMNGAFLPGVQTSAVRLCKHSSKIWAQRAHRHLLFISMTFLFNSALRSKRLPNLFFNFKLKKRFQLDPI